MKKKQQNVEILTPEELKKLQEEHAKELELNPKYSLDVDPEEKYMMNDDQKKFIRYYVEFKSINSAAELAGISIEEAKKYFVSWASQQEIRRINLALYQRQFSTKLLDLDQIGGYLSSLLTGENVVMADQLKSTEKLRVVELLMRLNEMKMNAMSDPNRLMKIDLSVAIKNLSIDTIQSLIAQTNKTEPIQNESLSTEEKAYLESLSSTELLKLLDETNKKS